MLSYIGTAARRLTHRAPESGTNARLSSATRTPHRCALARRATCAFTTPLRSTCRADSIKAGRAVVPLGARRVVA